MKRFPGKKNGLTGLLRRLTFTDAPPKDTAVDDAEGPCSFDNLICALPAELLLEIFGHLRIGEMYNVALVCKEFNDLSKDDFLWRKLYHRKWQYGALNGIRDWKSLAKHRKMVQEKWKKGSAVGRVLPASGRVWSVQLEGNRLVSSSTAATLHVWDLGNNSDTPTTTLRGHTAEVRCHQFLGDKLISGGYDSTVRVWDLKDGTCVKVLPHKADVYDLQFDDEKIVTCTRDSMIRVWDIEAATCLVELKGHSLCLRTVHCDENLIVSGGEDKTAKIWDTRDNHCVATLEGHKHGLTSLQFDSEKIVTGSFDASVKFWDMKTFRCLRTLHPKKASGLHTNRYHYHSPLSVWQLQYDDDKLVTAHADYSAKIWDVVTGTELASLKGHSGEVITLHFDTTRLVTGGEDKCMRLWDFEVPRRE